MKHRDRDPQIPRDEAGIEDLLRQVGAREEPSEAAAREIFAATHAAWQSTVAERTTKRRRMSWAIAASLVAVVAIGGAIAFKVSLQGTLAQPVPVASVARVEGYLQIESQQPGKSRSIHDAGQAIAIGETATTDGSTRAALSFGNALSVRLDHGTKIEVLAEDRLRLASGALYVDAGPIVNHTALTVQTATASIRHVGTQYSVRTVPAGIEVGVREGRVAIADNGVTHTGRSGEKILVTTNGEVTRTALPPRHADWQWAMSIAPSFNIDGQPLASFLEWIARESGRKLVYASEEARTAATLVKLHGSIADLDLNTALATVLSTTQLRLLPAEDESIGIALASAKP